MGRLSVGAGTRYEREGRTFRVVQVLRDGRLVVEDQSGGGREGRFAIEAIADLPEAANPVSAFSMSQARCTLRLPGGTGAAWELRRAGYGSSAPSYAWMRDEKDAPPLTAGELAAALRPLFDDTPVVLRTP